MKILFILLFPLTFIQGQTVEEKSVKEFDADQIEKFSSLGQGKSQGLKIHFKYPKSWKSLDGDRPHVVKKFVQSDNHTLAVLLINKIDKPFTQKDINEVFTTAGLKSIIPENAIYISSNPDLKIEQLKAGSIEYTTSTKRVDRVFYSHVLHYVFVYKNYYVTIQFMVADNPDETKGSVDSRYKTLYPLFYQMFNSVVIDNIYEK